ncbi:MAG: hypothetical protein ABIQ35_15090 [Verrucomicrobiota bacterium]
MDAFIAARVQRRERTRYRYDQAFREPILARFASRRLLDALAEDVLQLIQHGTVSTNMYFRRLHSYALMLGWLPWPILNYRQWPSRKYKTKRGMTAEEHRSLVNAEKNPESKAVLELEWHVGAAQIDLVSLSASDGVARELCRPRLNLVQFPRVGMARRRNFAPVPMGICT